VVGSAHLVERMIDRGFSEVDLREMLEDSIGVAYGSGPGRWIAECPWRGERWEVILEPDRASRVVVVVTAYRVD
jgi:hypothetical protein